MLSNDRQFDRKIFWVLIGLQALLFYNFYAREISWYPPLNDDQTTYLTQAYRLQERIRLYGVGELWQELWRNNHGSTLAFPIQGALMGLFFGGTRLPELGVLFIAFCALQFFAFETAQVIWGRRAYGYMVLGLILCQTTAWLWAGGLFDFRIDFLAYCLYGIWVCAAIRSQVFLDRRWAIVCGLISALLVLNRFVTITYLLGVCTGLAAACIILRFFARGHADLTRRLKQRLINIVLSVGILVLVVSPILLINWPAIHNWYGPHAIAEQGSVWAAKAGINSLAGHLFYYPNTILKDHLGPNFLWGSVLAIAVGLFARLVGRGQTGEPGWGFTRNETFLLQIIFLVGAVLGPVVVLTFDITKIPTVGGIVGGPVALLVVAVSAAVTPNLREVKSLSVGKAIVASSLVIFTIGLFTQFGHAISHLPQYAERHDLESIAELNKWIAHYARENGWLKPTISFDEISGSLNSGTITTSGFESSGELIEFQNTVLGSGIMGVDRAQALAALARSDFVVLTDLPKTDDFPFYERISKYWNDLKTWADQNMIVARRVRLSDFTATVYTRPTATVSGVSGDWITSAGLTLEVPNDVLHRFPKIRLSGAANYSWLPKIPSASATIKTSAEPQTVPTMLQRTDDSYEIMIDFSRLNLPPSDPISVCLTFDTFFVPKKIGINDDNRQLVLPAPTLVQLMRSGS
jgi:hypothetical protein